MSKIRISESATDKIPNPSPTGGSTSADLAGNALKDACDQINKRLAPLKAAKSEAPWEMIVGMAFGTKINLSAIGHWEQMVVLHHRCVLFLDRDRCSDWRKYSSEGQPY